MGTKRLTGVGFPRLTAGCDLSDASIGAIASLMYFLHLPSSDFDRVFTALRSSPKRHFGSQILFFWRYHQAQGPFLALRLPFRAIAPVSIPCEFIVVGKPISQQTKNKQRLQQWQARVSQAVTAHWQNPPVNQPLTITLTHFYDVSAGVGSADESGVPDSDNIIRPIRAVFSGRIYDESLAAVDFVSRRRNLNGTFRIRGMSPVLAEGFSKGCEFLHVKMQLTSDPADPS